MSKNCRKVPSPATSVLNVKFVGVLLLKNYDYNLLKKCSKWTGGVLYKSRTIEQKAFTTASDHDLLSALPLER